MADDETTDAPAESETSDQGEPTPPPAADLGDGGKKALDAERAARKAAEKAAKAAQAELDKLREANQTEQEKAIAAAKAEGRSEVLAEANKRLIAAEVRAAAATVLQDPADAIQLLDLDTFEVAEDGTVDQGAITAAIAGLVEAKPYLASGAAKAPPTGSAEGGARVPNKPSSLAEQIAEADKAGDLNRAMKLRTQLLMAAQPEGI